MRQLCINGFRACNVTPGAASGQVATAVAGAAATPDFIWPDEFINANSHLHLNWRRNFELATIKMLSPPAIPQRCRVADLFLAARIGASRNSSSNWEKWKWWTRERMAPFPGPCAARGRAAELQRDRTWAARRAPCIPGRESGPPLTAEASHHGRGRLGLPLDRRADSPAAPR